MEDQPRKLKYTEVGPTRRALLETQLGNCAICSQRISGSGALDHDHHTGAIRQVLHTGCNALLGKIENNYRRFGVPNLAAFLAGVARYLQEHTLSKHHLIHPTFKTKVEKCSAKKASRD